MAETTLRVNGEMHRLDVDDRASLLDTLREALALTGTKKGCDRGECGACTVHIDGRRALSCLTLAVMAEGKEITTIEGLTPVGGLQSGAVGFHRARRLSMRLLHPGSDHVCGRLHP